MEAKPKARLAILAGVIVAIVPATLGYLQNRDEIQSRYRQTQNDASNGYAALAASVKDLQKAVTEQHDYILKLEVRLEDVDRYMTDAITRIVATPALSREHRPVVSVRQRPRTLAPLPVLPKPDLPSDFAAAKQFDSKK